MRRGARFPHDQTEIVFSDVAAEQLEDLTSAEQIDVLADVSRLCAEPSGKHPLSGVLAGWNTLAVLGGHRRVVFRASIVDGVGSVEVLCLGPRSDSEVYDLAAALKASGALTGEEIIELWLALTFLDVAAEKVGLDGWDYRPPPAPEGMIRSVVVSGLLEQYTAQLLSRAELEAAMIDGWGEDGPDPERALAAAMRRARGSAEAFTDRVAADRALADRALGRCDAVMPRLQKRCIRRRGHPGPHRSSV